MVTPRYIVGMVVSSLDYAGVYGVYVLDRDGGAEIGRDAVTPFAVGARLPERSGDGRAEVRGPGLAVGMDQRGGGTRLRAVAPAEGIDVDLEVPRPGGHESLGVVVPWGPRRFQYTVKDVGRPVRGRIRVPAGEYRVPEEASFAVLDHGRGKWPYAVTWNWAAGHGRGRSVQFGGKWTDGTGMTENALILGGRVHKIGDELTWTYDRTDWTKPWRIGGPRVDVTFHPFHERAARTSLGVVASETHQCFGHFAGRVRADDGAWVDVDGLTGWAEEARNRW